MGQPGVNSRLKNFYRRQVDDAPLSTLILIALFSHFGFGGKEKMNNQKKGLRKFVIFGMIFLVGLCLILVAVTVIANKMYSKHSSLVDRLNNTDKARIAEVFHLQLMLGDQVLPGLTGVEIPVIAFNEDYIFLVGCQNPATGWRKIHQDNQLGGPWEAVPGDDFFGQTYYRQKLPAPGVHSENFTVQVGDQWVASLMTLEWMKISLVGEIRGDLPELIQPFFPYGLAVNLLVPSSDTYITGVLHEAIHAFQGIQAPERLASAEKATRHFGGQYPFDSKSFQDAWQIELDILQDAIRTSSQEETVRLARSFLNQRTERRREAGLSDELIDYERHREWEEGIAKYGELLVYLLAAQPETYQPLPELSQDREFQYYRGARQKWFQEIDQISRMADDEGDGRFYYSGFAQAVLLDRLAPDWKERLFTDGVWLEDLLTEAVIEP